LKKDKAGIAEVALIEEVTRKKNSNPNPNAEKHLRRPDCLYTEKLLQPAGLGGA
jgi:hypothetical protein